MSEIKSDKLSPRTASGTVTLGTSGDTFEVPSGVTLTNNGTANGFGVSNKGVAVHLGADQTLTRNVRTKVQFNVEDYDPEGWFDSTTNYRFLPDESGVYFISASLLQGNGAGADNIAMYIYKNGSEVFSNQVYQVSGTIAGMHSSGIVSLNGSSDYVEIYTMATSSSGTLTLDANGWNATNTTECRMSAMRLT